MKCKQMMHRNQFFIGTILHCTYSFWGLRLKVALNICPYAPGPRWRTSVPQTPSSPVTPPATTFQIKACTILIANAQTCSGQQTNQFPSCEWSSLTVPHWRSDRYGPHCLHALSSSRTCSAVLHSVTFLVHFDLLQSSIYTVGPKKVHHFICAITLSKHITVK